ncbi:MAG: class I SAM-dependent methyltransferase [Okeania sp. SIO3B5]|uniref:class I SAM-dependent DNA methyltransferase n=1 Tax=Okeania sp. SIO3B5 TaxID=2607811 RepID=UPI0013FF7FF7|nr:class I SAM-dependent methyltransferase [Okeania sp. SIO3B5]NEO56147.1 class I SAM-dependent methyltransferase [Okeania sp. SIO3B5]
MAQEKAKETENQRPWLSWICDSKSIDDLRRKYNTWASTYDTDVEKDWEFMPVNAARILANLLPKKDAAILDAGAGTGFVGEALAQQEYTNITAADLSEEMLTVARKKQVYKALFQCDLEDTQAFSKKETFDAIISVGVFAHAHAGFIVLQNLFCQLKRGGYFVLTVREKYYAEMQEAFESLPWTLISQEQFQVYDNEIIYVLGFRKQ